MNGYCYFILGILALAVGYFTYGRVLERIFRPDASRQTPAVACTDGVDYVVMPRWRVFLIQLLNIAGLGPIFGAVMGVLYGPAALLWIVFGCILGGMAHDYFSGMISLRHKGENLPEILGRYLGRQAQWISRAVCIVFSVLVGVFNCLLVLVIRPLFLLLYNVTPETYEAAYTIIGVLACLQLVLGIDVTCIVGILRGGGDTRTAFVYDCGALWLVSIPMGILAGLVLHLPVPLVYVCLKLDSPIKAFLSLLRIRSGKWIRNVTVQTSPMPPEEEAQRAAGME